MKVALYLGLVFLAACEPVIDSRGYNPDNMNFSHIQIGKTTKEQVHEILGSASSVSDIVSPCGKLQGWYYISKKTETTSFFKPKIVSQKVVRIIFDAKDVVKRIDDLSNAQGKDLDADSDQTATTGYEESLGRGVFGTFGRMLNSNAKKKKDQDSE